MQNLGQRITVERLVDAPGGPVRVWGAVLPESLARLTMDSSLRLFRPPEQQKKALLAIAAHPANMLTVRCGARVPPAACEAFRLLAAGQKATTHHPGLEHI